MDVFPLKKKIDSIILHLRNIGDDQYFLNLFILTLHNRFFRVLLIPTGMTLLLLLRMVVVSSFMPPNIYHH